MALIDNIESYYKCDDNAANTTVTDELSNNTGTSSTNTSNLNTTGKLGDAFNFNGSSEYFTVPNATFNWAGNFSVNLWFKSNSDDNMCFFGAQSGATGFTLDYGMNGGAGQLGCVTISGSSSSAYAAWTRDNNWHMLTVTYDGTNLTVYLDGSQHVQNTSANAPTNSSTAIAIARRESLNDFYFDGDVDAVGVWNKELSSGEVTELWNSGNGLEYPFSAGTNLQLNIGDSWKDVDAIKINIGDLWKTVDGAQINIGDSWKSVF